MTLRRTTPYLALPLLALLCVPACSRRQAAQDTKSAPDFTLNDADGRPVRLSDHKGKVVLLNFWATWCGPCKVEIPWFMEFEQRFKDRGFAVIGVSMDEEGWDVVRPYLAGKRVNYRVVVGNDEVGKLYGGIDSLPTTFLLDREGRIVSTHVGLVSKSVYENEIQQLLDKRASTGGNPVLGGGTAVARNPRRAG